MTAVALIPARMKSERIPRKNLREIKPGLTLVQQAVDCAVKSGCFSRVIVTSDEDIPVADAELIRQPDALSGPLSDISSVAQWLLMHHAKEADWIATLQPAVLARSPQIVRDLCRHCVDAGMSGVTMAESHPWAWTETSGGLMAWWRKGGVYPRSQSMPRTMVEINSCQITAAAVAARGDRWRAPLAVLELPYWSQQLDIDTPNQLIDAIDLWPWAESRLATWRGTIYKYGSIQ
jgi:CMP-N-acetylneuraminic acid synthetase